MTTQVRTAGPGDRYDWQPGQLRNQVAIPDLSTTPLLVHAGGTLLHDLICSALGVETWLHVWDCRDASDVAGLAPMLILRVPNQGTLPLSFAVARSFYNGLVVAASPGATAAPSQGAYSGIPPAFLSEPAGQPLMCLSLNYSAG